MLDVWMMSAFWWSESAWMFPHTRSHPDTQETFVPLAETEEEKDFKGKTGKKQAAFGWDILSIETQSSSADGSVSQL